MSRQALKKNPVVKKTLKVRSFLFWNVGMIFWNDICDKLSIICKQKVTASPLMCLLGILPPLLSGICGCF